VGDGKGSYIGIPGVREAFLTYTRMMSSPHEMTLIVFFFYDN
jgi:hypothetical protein